jgi:hypothetical protein
MKKLKEAFILFVIQIVLYSILYINFRAVVQANYHQAALTGFLISSINFFVIQKISKSTESFHQWIGYVTGSVIGAYVGIYLSITLN